MWAVGIGGSKSSPDIGRLEHEPTCVSFASSLGFPSNGSSMSTVLLLLGLEDDLDLDIIATLPDFFLPPFFGGESGKSKESSAVLVPFFVCFLFLAEEAEEDDDCELVMVTIVFLVKVPAERFAAAAATRLRDAVGFLLKVVEANL